MSDLLEIPDAELHCCIKAISSDGEYRDRVITWARSEPQDTHKDDKKLDGDHRFDNNSVYASLMARNDGNMQWKRPFTCFSCNDLISEKQKFKCSRNKWEEHYKSTMVFPLRYLVDPSQKEFYTIGFLCFYSNKKNVFVGMPNIFDHIYTYDTYIGKLAENTAFQIGACMTDILSTFLRDAYKQDKLDKRKNTKNSED